MSKRFLIFSAAFGHTNPLPTAFLQSARQAAIQADIVLLRHRRELHVEQDLKQLYPETHVIAPLRYGLLRIVRKILLSTRLAVPVAKVTQGVWKRSPSMRKKLEAFIPYLVGIMVSRFFLARSFLAERGNEYSAVLLIDSRDVVFQRNPLDDFEGGLLVGNENCIIENQPVNCEWLQRVYGKSAEVLNELWPKKLICAGVTLGTTLQVLSYLDQMCTEFIEQLPRLTYFEGLDQAVHNKILYLGCHNLDLRLTDNSKGIVANLHGSDLSEFEDNWLNGLRTKDGQVVSIVHQYDRHLELMRVLFARIGLNSERGPASIEG